MGLEKPDPPLIVSISHHNVTLEWSHCKSFLPARKKYKYRLQEHRSGRLNWKTVYMLEFEGNFSNHKTLKIFYPNIGSSFRI